MWLKRFSSMRVTAFLLVAFMILTFWGVLAQAGAESAGQPASVAVDRFFGSYFVWALGIVPLPAFKLLALVSALQIVASMVYRMPRGWRNLGLYVIHVALLVLLLGSLSGSEIRREYNGFALVPAGGAELVDPAGITFYAPDDSTGKNPVKGGSFEGNFAYRIAYRGAVEMTAEKTIALYSAVYDPFRFVPYAFMALFLFGAFYHYFFKVRVAHRKGGKAGEKIVSCENCAATSGEKFVSGENCAATSGEKFVSGEDCAATSGEKLISGEDCAATSGEKLISGENCAAGGKAGVRSILLLVACLLAVTFPGKSCADEPPAMLWLALPPDAPVLVDSVVRPFDSFARGFLDDLNGRVKYKCKEGDGCRGKLPATSVVEMMGYYPEKAKRLRLFKVLRSDVSEILHLPVAERYVSFEELSQARSLMELYASRDDGHPATNEIRRLYANYRLYDAVVQGNAYAVLDTRNAFARFPAVADHPETYPVDAPRLKAEVFYHKANFALWAFVLAVVTTLLSAVNSLFRSRKLDVGANVACILSSAVLAIAFALRTYVAARPPMSSLYEIVLLVALLLVGFESGAFLFCRRRTFTLMVPVTLMASFLLFFAKFVLEPGDTFRPIPAVLNSSVFLTMHVFTIALGFAAMILSGIIAHVALFRAGNSPATSSASLPAGPAALASSLPAGPAAPVPPSGESRVSAHRAGSPESGISPDSQVTAPLPEEGRKNTPIESLLYATLVFGAVFTVIGTLLGGVWADYAWGRFWGFDPKECGALFVILWAMLALHLRGGRLVTSRGFALFNCFNVIVTFLCWFGINLLGVGLHSYGFQDGSALWLEIFVLLDTLAIYWIYRRSLYK